MNLSKLLLLLAALVCSTASASVGFDIPTSAPEMKHYFNAPAYSVKLNIYHTSSSSQPAGEVECYNNEEKLVESFNIYCRRVDTLNGNLYFQFVPVGVLRVGAHKIPSTFAIGPRDSKYYPKDINLDPGSTSYQQADLWVRSDGGTNFHYNYRAGITRSMHYEPGYIKIPQTHFSLGALEVYERHELSIPLEVKNLTSIEASHPAGMNAGYDLELPSQRTFASNQVGNGRGSMNVAITGRVPGNYQIPINITCSFL